MVELVFVLVFVIGASSLRRCRANQVVGRRGPFSVAELEKSQLVFVFGRRRLSSRESSSDLKFKRQLTRKISPRRLEDEPRDAPFAWRAYRGVQLI